LALNYLHSEGIVHGDLRPENILLDCNGFIKLTDFGSSKLMNLMQQEVKFEGDLSYIAPEVLSERKITKASDWWTFGLLLYDP